MKKVLFLFLLPFVVSTVVFSGGRGDAAAAVDSYPTRAVRWVVPAPAGAPLDLATRVLIDAINTLDFNQSLVVENIPGANQTIGLAEVARRPADGYTWYTTAAAGMISQPLMTPLTYGFRDFRHIQWLTPPVLLLVAVRADSPLRNAQDLMDFIRSGARFAWSTSFAGTAGHLQMSSVKDQMGRFGDPNAIFMSYSGMPEAIMAVLNREVDMMIIDNDQAVPRVQNGELRVLAALHNERCHLFPDAPALSEYGITGLGTVVGLRWIGVRADTPEPIVTQIKDIISRAIETPLYQDFLVRSHFPRMRAHSEEEVTGFLLNRAFPAWEAAMRLIDLID